MKSANVKPAAEPIMILGGSPISVAVPPMLDAMISMRKYGIGLISSSLQMVSVMGPIRSTVVTLSSTAESTAVSSTNKTMIFHGSPLASFAVLTARNSNMPDSRTTATNSIMPNSTPSVLKSICEIAVSNDSTWASSRITVPAMATSVRWIFSDMMVTIATMKTAMANIWLKSIASISHHSLQTTNARTGGLRHKTPLSYVIFHHTKAEMGFLTFRNLRPARPPQTTRPQDAWRESRAAAKTAQNAWPKAAQGADALEDACESGATAPGGRAGKTARNRARDAHEGATAKRLALRLLAARKPRRTKAAAIACRIHGRHTR